MNNSPELQSPVCSGHRIPAVCSEPVAAAWAGLVEIGPSMDDQEWAVLQALKDQDTVGTQRDIAQGSGLSLGLTNAVLKQLIKKGYLIAKRINGRNLSYALTPEGVDEYTKRTYRYLRRTMKKVKTYKDSLKHLVESAGCGINLVGSSELDFLLEYHCLKNQISFTRSSFPVEGVLNVYSEDSRGMDSPGCIYLRNVVEGTEGPPEAMDRGDPF